MDTHLPAIAVTRDLARRDAGELIVIGQFALRQPLQSRTHEASRVTIEALPPAHHGYGSGGPTVLPTEHYLALRTATSAHRKAAYAACR